MALQAVNSRQDRALAHQALAKGVQCRLVSPDLDEHPLAIVTYITAEAQFPRQPPDGGTKADPLDQSPDPDALGAGAADAHWLS